MTVAIYSLPKIHNLKISILLGNPDACKELIQKPSTQSPIPQKMPEKNFCFLWNCLWKDDKGQKVMMWAACKHKPKFPKSVSYFGKQSLAHPLQVFFGSKFFEVGTQEKGQEETRVPFTCMNNEVKIPSFRLQS